MSSESLPITRERFVKALEGLSLSSLYLKVAELRNSILHLEKSNQELEEFVRQEDDKECYEAVLENREVIARMEERIDLIKKEVTEVRCLPWQPEDGDRIVEVGERRNGDVEMVGSSVVQQNGTTTTSNGVTSEQRNGTQAAENGTETQEDGGVFL